MSELISVIIPVYNVEGYLEKCIDSVRRQTYGELQIILVDDGSTDGSGKLCDTAAKEDGRIEVVHKTNGGLSSARNAGLEKAKGRYICFPDSDDWLAPCFVESLYRIAKEKDADIAVCGFKRVKDENEAGLCGAESAEMVTEYDNYHAVKEVIEEKNIKSVVWNKLYASYLFENSRFSEGRTHEDEFITYKLLWESKKVAETDRVLYYYRVRDNSITGSGDKELWKKRAYDVFDAQHERYLFFDEREKKLAGPALVKYLDYLKHSIRSGLIRTAEDKKEVARLYRADALKVFRYKGTGLGKKFAVLAWMVLIRFL
jgi:glycosyltransferase involved in cell wall biosynthesis